jgi:hypothetical protein
VGRGARGYGSMGKRDKGNAAAFIGPGGSDSDARAAALTEVAAILSRAARQSFSTAGEDGAPDDFQHLAASHRTMAGEPHIPPPPAG